jgi:GT2 family glycosyltransferase
MCDVPSSFVSIVIATYQRLSRLQRCIEHIRSGLRVPYEIVVVDGGSGDGTAEWVRGQADIRLHVERDRGGCCRAYNLGFRLACGSHVMWLNDDAWPLPGAIDAALALLQRPDMRDVGLVAFYHNHRQPWNELHGIDRGGQRFGVLHVRGLPYANFGLLRRSLLEQIGFLDGRYVFCGWDPDLSLKVQREAELRVIGAPAALVYHEELIDERKQHDADTLRQRDNERLFAKWALPEKGAFPDPRPAYLRLIEERGLVETHVGAAAH